MFRAQSNKKRPKLIGFMPGWTIRLWEFTFWKLPTPIWKPQWFVTTNNWSEFNPKCGISWQSLSIVACFWVAWPFHFEKNINQPKGANDQRAHGQGTLGRLQLETKQNMFQPWRGGGRPMPGPQQDSPQRPAAHPPPPPEIPSWK